jgi:hypothetical protein
VVLPLKALMLMVSLGEAVTEGKVGFKDMGVYNIATLYLNRFSKYFSI